jgi:hypothetical protein
MTTAGLRRAFRRIRERTDRERPRRASPPDGPVSTPYLYARGSAEDGGCLFLANRPLRRHTRFLSDAGHGNAASYGMPADVLAPCGSAVDGAFQQVGLKTVETSPRLRSAATRVNLGQAVGGSFGGIDARHTSHLGHRIV